MLFVVQFRWSGRSIDRRSRVTQQFSGPDTDERLERELHVTRASRIRVAVVTVWFRQRVSHKASDLGALGGTRTPNLLIRRCRHSTFVSVAVSRTAGRCGH